jgi:hypothetical protein
VCGLVAAIVAYVCAYERASLTGGSRRQVRRLALQATPGPFVYFLLLGLFISFAVPYFAMR